MFTAATHGLPWTATFLELNSRLPIRYLGFAGIDAIGRRSSKCTATEWVLSRLPRELIEIAHRRPFPPPPDPQFEGLESIREYAFGGVMREVLAAKEKGGRVGPDDLEGCFERGVRAGLKALVDDNATRMRLLRKAGELVEAVSTQQDR